MRALNPAYSAPAGRRQRGVSAITALVLIVLFALIGAYMATITGVQSLTSTLSSRTDQAWFAANSGAEWGIYQVLVNNDCSGFPATLAITGGSGSDFTVVVRCSLTNVTEGSDNYNVYQLSSEASNGSAGEIGFVQRTVRVSVADAS